jgi:phospholipid/cholesterol/gamma-HCH transport system substrate-binding protein
MEYRSSEYKVGLFIFLSLITLAVFIFFLGDVKERFKPKKNIHIVFNFTGNLEAGAPVRYAGLLVGRVAKIDLLHSQEKNGMDRVTVTAEINPSIKVRRDSIASIKTSGLMGGPYIDIRPGSATSHLLIEGEQLLGQDAFQFTEMGDMVEEVVLQVRKFIQIAEALGADSRETLRAFKTSLDSVNGILVDNRGEIRDNLKNLVLISNEISSILDGNGDRISDTFKHIHALSKTAERLVIDNEKSIANIVDQTESLTGELEALLKENRQGVTALVRALKQDTGSIASDVDSAVNSLDQTLLQTSGILVENRRNLMELIHNLNESSRNLKSITADLKRNPWKLVRKSPEKGPENKNELVPVLKPSEIRMQRLNKVSKN